jgi:hypothetical protein
MPRTNSFCNAAIVSPADKAKYESPSLQENLLHSNIIKLQKEMTNQQTLKSIFVKVRCKETSFLQFFGCSHIGGKNKKSHQ